MPKRVMQYDLLISCAGDIRDEIEVINRTVQRFNDQFSDTLGISIRTRHWSKSSYSQSGGKPQALLNEQFVKNCDAAVALLWTRFGTPTDQYGSGTEEEIEIMLEAGKQVFLYFSERPVSPSEMDSDGYAKVQALKQKYKDRGIYFSYSTIEEFERLFYAHLTQYFIKKASDDAQPKRASQLVLRGIDAAGKLCEKPTLLDFRLNSPKNSDTLLTEIKKLYQKIGSIHLEQRHLVKDREDAESLALSLTSWHDSLYPPATIDEDIKTVIMSVAKALGIPLVNDFFNLGNLYKNSMAVSILGGGRSYSGTPKEELKYESITKLHDLILEFHNWLKIEEAYAGLSCITLAIENGGTAVDEDVEVELHFDADALLPLDRLPIIQDESTIKYLLDECDLEDLLSIPPTSQYKAYEVSQKLGSYAANPNHNSLDSFIGRDYQEEYWDSITDIYCYEIFEEQDQCIMKVKFDYIKHHTAIAFPTPIFLQQVPTEIEYTITSQNSPDIISGKLLVTNINQEQ